MFQSWFRHRRCTQSVRRLTAGVEDCTAQQAADTLVHFLFARARMTQQLRGFDPMYPIHDGNRAEMPPRALLKPLLDELLDTQQCHRLVLSLPRDARGEPMMPDGSPPPFGLGDLRTLTARLGAATLGTAALAALWRRELQGPVGKAYEALIERGLAMLPQSVAWHNETVWLAAESDRRRGVQRPPSPPIDAPSVERFLRLTHPWMAGGLALPPQLD